MKKLKFSLRYHWGVFLYMIALTACFNTMGHGSFDLYPTFLTTQRKLTVKEETWVTIILQSGGWTLRTLARSVSGMWCGPDTIRLGQCHETVPSSAAGLACGMPPIIPPSMSFITGLDEKSDAV
jgi:hypothetical protein